MSGHARILILGAAGQVGRELAHSFAGAGEIVAAGRETVDLSREEPLRMLVRDLQPRIILNAAAYTAVDRAEQEQDLALAINAHAPRVLAEEALRCGALLVHYSTDYVFDGSKREPWVESDPTAPLNVYGATKLAGEQAIQHVGGRSLIFRTSWVYGPHGKNFLLTMLRLGREREQLSIVDDQIGSPTTSIEIAHATRAAVDAVLAGRCGSPAKWAGIYHMTCSGAVSWYGFAQAIFARAEAQLGLKPPRLSPIASADYPTPARRPAYSVLSNARMQTHLGIELAPWQVALDQVFATLDRTGA